MPKIRDIRCHKIINSRGDWTIETRVELDDGAVGEQAIPDGASKGQNEAVYVPVDKAVDVVEHPIADLLRGQDPGEQLALDTQLLKMDGTSNKAHLGGNSILSVSLAIAKAVANSKGCELYAYLAEVYGKKISGAPSFPTPVFNVLNGGKHADNDLSFQEFMVIPSQGIPIREALEMGVEIYDQLETNLKSAGYSTEVGDEGGFAPSGITVHKALELIKNAARQKYTVGKQVFFGLDVAAESFFKNDQYELAEEHKSLSADALAKYYMALFSDFELMYIEDPFYEGDTDGWQEFYAKCGQKTLIVGDDLVVTNAKFLKKAVADKLINAVIVKPNQVGTLTETFEFIKMAKEHGLAICVSHRSGDNADDTFIADLAVAVEADFMKSGAPARGERVAKYNRLLDIADTFNSS